MENKSRKEAEFDREQLDKKMSAVQDLLLNDRDLRDETRSKIERLNYCPKKRKSAVNDHHLEEFGNEINSTGSFLSNLSVTQSEDDFLDVGRPSKGWKKHRPSYPEHSGVYVGGKRSRKSSDGLRKSINNSKKPFKLDLQLQFLKLIFFFQINSLKLDFMIKLLQPQRLIYHREMDQ